MQLTVIFVHVNEKRTTRSGSQAATFGGLGEKRTLSSTGPQLRSRQARRQAAAEKSATCVTARCEWETAPAAPTSFAVRPKKVLPPVAATTPVIAPCLAMLPE